MATKCSQSPASSSEIDIDAIAEFDNLRSLEENEKGSVHGLVGQVSPMIVGRTGKGYFHALLTDGAQDVKIVGFGKSSHHCVFLNQHDLRMLISSYCTCVLLVALAPCTNALHSPSNNWGEPERVPH